MSNICPKCKTIINDDSPYECPKCRYILRKKGLGYSGIGIAAFCISLCPCLFWLGPIVATIDLTNNDGKKKTFSWISMAISAVMCVFIYLTMGIVGVADSSSTSKTQVSAVNEKAVATSAPTPAPTPTAAPKKEVSYYAEYPYYGMDGAYIYKTSLGYPNETDTTYANVEKFYATTYVWKDSNGKKFCTAIVSSWDKDRKEKCNPRVIYVDFDNALLNNEQYHKYQDSNTSSNSSKNSSSGSSYSDYGNKKDYKNASDYADDWYEEYYEYDDYEDEDDAWDGAYDDWYDQ